MFGRWASHVSAKLDEGCYGPLLRTDRWSPLEVSRLRKASRRRRSNEQEEELGKEEQEAEEEDGEKEEEVVKGI